MKKQSLFLLRSSLLIITLICCSQIISAQLACGAGEISYDQTITYDGTNIEQNHTFDFAVCPGWNISDARITVMAQGDLDGDSGQDESWTIGTEFSPNSFTIGNGGDPSFQCINTLSQGPFTLSAAALIAWKSDGLISFTATANDDVAFGICLGNDLISVRLEMCYAECAVPVANCQDATVNLDANGMGSILAADINNGSTASCSDLSFALTGQQDFTCADIGQTFAVTLSTTDECGGSDNCTANISVVDNQAPVLNCSGVTTTLSAGANCTALSAGSATIVDNCSPVNVNFTFTGPDGTVLASQAVFPLATGVFDASNLTLPLGATTLDVLVTDQGGLTDNCSVTITVEDVTAPTLTNCSGSIQSANLNCEYIGGGALFQITDNCGPVTLNEEYFDEDGNNFLNDQFTLGNGFYGLGGGRIFPLGVNTLVLTVTDDAGLTGTCSVNIEVQDNTPPDAICQNFTVTLDNDGNGSIAVTDINNGSNDNCTPLSDLDYALVGLTDFTCDNIGNNTVNLLVTDLADNAESCTATVTVEDTQAAEIQCRQPVSTVNTPGLCMIENLTVLEPFSIYDNCGAENVTFTRSPAGDDFPVGTTTLTWSATDANGNISTCESLVIIEDNEAPTVASCNAAIDFLDINSCMAQVIVTTDVFDNCGIVSVNGIGTFTLPIGIHPNPITVTDVNGNVTVHDFTIYIHDEFAPEFTNCPEETVTLQAGANGTAEYPAQPVATDYCGVPTITNDLPEGGLPMGSSVVTFTAQDAYGNLNNCVVNVEVTGGISLHPVSDIQSSLAENETAQTIAWNALNAGTVCELCEETSLDGFEYIGTWWGHQYFLADEASLTRDEASLIAETYDAHLAVINDPAENLYLIEALSEDIRSAWIGLMPQLAGEEWTFAWDNGDALDFDATDDIEINADTRIVLASDGIWKDATNTEDKHFLIERPCVDFTQTGPMYTPQEEEPSVLLRSGDLWPQGEYEVTYALTDMCGNEAVMNFDVDVLSDEAEYCTTEGVNNNVWIEKIVFHDLTNETENNEGYADFSAETTTMNIGDGVVLLQMEAGGNEAENMLYWNVYMDANSDGDFFDAGEMLYQTASREAIETNLTLPVVSLENARLRVMVSRYGFAAPCGDTYVGEIEDYNLNLLVPEDYARAACEVDVAGLNGERNGFTVDLDWTVNSACPIENYTIEYSTNGVNFVSVTQIEETDFSDLVYTKEHSTNLPAIVGTVIYRVKIQTPYQPAFYTNAVSFLMNGKPNAPILHPNPANTYVSIALGEYVGQSGNVTIYDNLGKVRMRQEFDTSTGDEMILNLSKFIDGIYHVSIETDGRRTQTQRLVIDKLYGWSPTR